MFPVATCTASHDLSSYIDYDKSTFISVHLHGAVQKIQLNLAPSAITHMLGLD